jgi:hypothetical protein
MMNVDNPNVIKKLNLPPLHEVQFLNLRSQVNRSRHHQGGSIRRSFSISRLEHRRDYYSGFWSLWLLDSGHSHLGVGLVGGRIYGKSEYVLSMSSFVLCQCCCAFIFDQNVQVALSILRKNVAQYHHFPKVIVMDMASAMWPATHGWNENHLIRHWIMSLVERGKKLNRDTNIWQKYKFSWLRCLVRSILLLPFTTFTTFTARSRPVCLKGCSSSYQKYESGEARWTYIVLFTLH